MVLRSAVGGGDARSTTVRCCPHSASLHPDCWRCGCRRTSSARTGRNLATRFAAVIHGFASERDSIGRARPAMRAVTVVTIHRVAFGMITVLAILLLRNTLNPPSEPSRPRPNQSRRRRCSRRCTDRSHRHRPWHVDRTCLVGNISLVIIRRRPHQSASLLQTLPSMIIGGVALDSQVRPSRSAQTPPVQHRIPRRSPRACFSLYDVVINIGLVCLVSRSLHSPAQQWPVTI